LRNDGLTEQEGKVMDSLIDAWNEFNKLSVEHPSDNLDFANAIHQCQQIMGMRILRREHPKGWAVKESKRYTNLKKCNPMLMVETADIKSLGTVKVTRT